MNVKINDTTQPTEINWDKSQLLECIDTDTDTDRIIVMYTGNHSGNYFNGVNLFNPNYTSGWLKECFKPFNGTITLSND